MALKSWEEASASPAYQNADEQGKQQMRDQYVKAGGTIPTTTGHVQAPETESNMIHDAAQGVSNFVKGAGVGVGEKLASAASGLGRMAGNATQELGYQTGSQDLLQSGRALSAYARRTNDDAQKSMQGVIDRGGSMAEAGRFVGGVGADIGAMVVAPEVAIPAIAAREMGSAYSRQKAGDEDIGKAGLVGAANYLAGRILPGAGGDVAEGILGTARGVAQKAAQGAWAGAKGGAVVGAAMANNDDQDILTGAAEGAMHGAAFGGAIGGTHATISAVRGGAGRVAPTLTDEGVLPAPTAEVNNPNQMNAIAGSELLASRGIPLTDARLAGNPDAQTAFGKSADQVNESRDVGRARQLDTKIPILGSRTPEGSLGTAKEQWERGGRQLNNDMNTSLESVSNSVNQIVKQTNELISNTYSTEGGQMAGVMREQLAPLEKFKYDFTAYKNMMNKAGDVDSARQDLIERAGIQAQESLNNLQPEVRAEIQKNFIPVKGLGDSMDFAGHAKVFGNAMSQLKEMHPGFKTATTNPTGGPDVAVANKGVVGLLRTGVDALKANRARTGFLKEQDAARAQTMQLAAGARNAEQAVAATRPSENPPTEVRDDVGLQMEDGSTAQQAQEQAPIVEPVAPTPDSVMTRSPRRPVAHEPEPVTVPEPVVEAPVEAPQSSPDQTLTRTPTRPQAAPEPVQEAPVEAPVEPAPAPQPDALMTRTPRQPEAPVEAPVEPAPAPQPDALLTQVPRRPEAPVEEAPVEVPAPVEEAPAPQPDQELVRAPRQPEQPAPVEEVALPVEEAPAPTPDQLLTQEPRRPVTPEPAPVEPEPVVAPEPTTEPPKPEPDQTMTRQPKAAEKPAEAAPEPTPEPVVGKGAPKEEVSAAEHLHRAAKAKKLQNLKDGFSDAAIKDRITLDNMDDKGFIQHLRREDNANNVEKSRHIAETSLKQRMAREERQDELNRKELDRWGQEEKIPNEYIQGAIKSSGLTKARILGVNAIKQRAIKEYIKDTAPKSYPEVAQETASKTSFKEQQDDLHSLVMGMDKGVQSEVLKALRSDARFRASEGDAKPLSESELRDIRVKMYNTESRVQTKLGNEKAAAEAEANAAKLKQETETKAAETKAQEQKAKEAAELAEKQTRLTKMVEQTDRVQSEIDKVLKDVPKADRDEWTHTYMDRHFGVTENPMTDLQLQKAIIKAGEAADSFKAKVGKMNSVQKEQELHQGESNKALEEAQKMIEELQGKIKGTGKESMKEGLKDVSSEVISKAEHALRHFGDDGMEGVKAVDDAVKLLSDVYGHDVVKAQPMVNFARVAKKAAEYKEQYPDNPEMWVTQEDFTSLAHAGTASGQGLMTKMANATVGKNYDQINPLTEAERTTRAKRIDSGESVKPMDLTKTGKAREAQLQGGGLAGATKSLTTPRFQIKRRNK